MSGLVNDLLRRLIGMAAALSGGLLTAAHHLRILTYRRRHRRLARRLSIEVTTAIAPYGPETEARIQQAAGRVRGPASFALTSGSAGQPKRILYTPARVRAVKRTFVDVFCRMFWAVPLRRRSLFIMSGIGDDESLTHHLLAEHGAAGRLALLQAPYRILWQQQFRELIAAYGMTPVRLLLLTVANPGLLYATNPSTLSTFFDELAAAWSPSARLVAELHRGGQTGFDAANLWRALASVASRGWKQRLALIAESGDRPPPVQAWLPGLQAYVCWTGGYVRPFLERLARRLPPPRYRLIPMYSMSTEAIETVTHFRRATGSGSLDVSFLPLGPGTLHELLPEDAADSPERLLPPWRARPGCTYALVVSDQYGLRRYQTDDLFRCTRLIGGLPDLSFLRRRTLEHSFTGEKVTDQQLALVFEELRRCSPDGEQALFLTCIPSQPPGDGVPHYRLVVVAAPLVETSTSASPAAPGLGRVDLPALVAAAEARLRLLNSEYRDKVASGRLGPLRGELMNLRELAALVGGERHGSGWEAQLKFLPLYTRTFEEMTGGRSSLIETGGPGAFPSHHCR